MSTCPFTVLEIGSGSFKLHHNDKFSLRFQSSLGKGLQDDKLNPESVKIAINSLENEIIPFLRKQKIELKDVLVFATAAVRRTKDHPSGRGFINKLQELGFRDVKIFSEDDECNYSAWAVSDALKDSYKDFLLLDTGGASHQLIEFRDSQIRLKNSFPIGSHSDLSQQVLPDFGSLSYSKSLALALIGTTGVIVNNLDNLSRLLLNQITETLPAQSIAERKAYLKSLIQNTSVHELLVDFRLAVLPNALKIICNCANNLAIEKFLGSSKQAMDYVSEHGFSKKVFQKINPM